MSTNMRAMMPPPLVIGSQELGNKSHSESLSFSPKSFKEPIDAAMQEWIDDPALHFSAAEPMTTEQFDSLQGTHQAFATNSPLHSQNSPAKTVLDLKGSLEWGISSAAFDPFYHHESSSCGQLNAKESTDEVPDLIDNSFTEYITPPGTRRSSRKSASPSQTPRKKRHLIPVEEAAHECKVCGTLFKRSYDGNSHMETHNPEHKWHPCIAIVGDQPCTKNFQRKSDLDRHHDSVHLGAHKHRCELCGNRFDRRDSWRFVISSGLYVSPADLVDIPMMAVQRDMRLDFENRLIPQPSGRHGRNPMASLRLLYLLKILALNLLSSCFSIKMKQNTGYWTGSAILKAYLY